MKTKQNTINEQQALQNFANNFNMKVHVRNYEDSRKKNTYFLEKGNETISPCLDYKGLNNFLLGYLRCSKKMIDKIPMKNKTTATQLQKAISKLMEKYDEGEIFDNLVSQCEKQKDGKIDWLVTQMIDYLTINKRMNVIKPETLVQQMKLEETIENLIIPFSSQTEIHLSY